jgi:hypothetical protein
VINRSVHPETRSGDPFAYAGERLKQAREGIPERRSEAECAEAIAEEEERRGYPMSYRERVAFAYGFHAPSYRADIRRLMAGVVVTDDEDL